MTVAKMDAKSQDLGLRVLAAAHSSLDRRIQPRGTIRAKVEGGVKRGAAWMLRRMRNHSFIGVTGAGAIGVAAATALGVGELAVGAALAYAAYNVFVRGESAEQAFVELAEELEGEVGGHGHHAHG